jgi:hypothetical protein
MTLVMTSGLENTAGLLQHQEMHSNVAAFNWDKLVLEFVVCRQRSGMTMITEL